MENFRIVEKMELFRNSEFLEIRIIVENWENSEHFGNSDNFENVEHFENLEILKMYTEKIYNNFSGFSRDWFPWKKNEHQRDWFLFSPECLLFVRESVPFNSIIQRHDLVPCTQDVFLSVTGMIFVVSIIVKIESCHFLEM